MMKPTVHHRYEIRGIPETRVLIGLFFPIREVKVHQQLWIDEADARINQWRDVPVVDSCDEAFG